MRMSPVPHATLDPPGSIAVSSSGPRYLRKVERCYLTGDPSPITAERITDVMRLRVRSNQTMPVPHVQSPIRTQPRFCDTIVITQALRIARGTSLAMLFVLNSDPSASSYSPTFTQADTQILSLPLSANIWIDIQVHFREIPNTVSHRLRCAVRSLFFDTY